MVDSSTHEKDDVFSGEHRLLCVLGIFLIQYYRQAKDSNRMNQKYLTKLPVQIYARGISSELSRPQGVPDQHCAPSPKAR